MPSGSYYLTFTSQADQDIFETVAWYEGQQKGLGFRFEAELSRALSKILNGPLHFQVLRDSVRRCNLSVFPYAIFYKVESMEIRVLGVIGFKRDPSIWQRF